ncbi:unnamed protein product [Absidia cylindrospora]
MVLNNDPDLPAELVKKLEGLQLELEDGDITQKGYDKKRTTLLEQYTQQKKEEEEALLASLGPEPSAADVIDFLDYLPSPTHSPPRPSSGEDYMEQNYHDQQRSSSSTFAPVPTPHISSTANNSNNNEVNYPTTDPYQQRQQHWSQQQQQYSYGQLQQSQQPPVGYPAENTMVSGQYYPSSMVSGSPRPNRPYDPRMARPQYISQPQQYYASQSHTTTVAPRPLPSTPVYQQQQHQQQQQRPMPFPGSSYLQQRPQQQRPMYPNQSRPVYRPGASPSMVNGGMSRPSPANGSGVYYRPGPTSATTPKNYPPPGYPLQGRSPTLDQQRVPYGYTGGVSRSSSQGRYS